MRAGQVIDDLLDGFLSRGRADRRAGASAQALGHFHTQLDPVLRRVLLQRLRVRVGNHEVNAVEFFLDHVVDRVAACPADAENGDPGFQVFLSGHRKVQCHCSVRLFIRVFARLPAEAFIQVYPQ